MARRSVLFAAALVAASIGYAGAASANDLTISTTSGRLGNGGEFKITGYDTAFMPPAAVVTTLDGGQFNTFCVEENEFVSLGSTYNYTVETGAIHGGVSGGDPDPIGEATAKLFYTFWQNKWSVSNSGGALNQNISFNYANSGGTRGVDGRDLQEAIWFLEGEVTQTDVNNYVSAHSGSQAQKMIDYSGVVSWSNLGQSGWTGAGGVLALNLWDAAGAAIQSQLVIVPLPTTAVMGFALLAGIGLVGFIRRRKLARTA